MPESGVLLTISSSGHNSNNNNDHYNISALGHLAHFGLRSYAITRNFFPPPALCPSPLLASPASKWTTLPVGAWAGELSPASGYLRAGCGIALPFGARRHFERPGEVRLPVWVVMMVMTGRRPRNPDGVMFEEGKPAKRSCFLSALVGLSSTGGMGKGCRGTAFQHEHGLLVYFWGGRPSRANPRRWVLAESGLSPCPLFSGPCITACSEMRQSNKSSAGASPLVKTTSCATVSQFSIKQLEERLSTCILPVRNDWAFLSAKTSR